MTTQYQPEHLERWTLPDCYFGETWEEWYVFLGRHRGSDILTNSNFEVALKELKSIPEPADWPHDERPVMAVCENHWAVGWVEWIAIHEDATAALEAADEIAARLEDYPVVDEDDWSERECEAEYEDWEFYGRSDFVDWLGKELGLRDENKDRIDEVDSSYLLQWGRDEGCIVGWTESGGFFFSNPYHNSALAASLTKLLKNHEKTT